MHPSTCIILSIVLPDVVRVVFDARAGRSCVPSVAGGDCNTVASDGVNV